MPNKLLSIDIGTHKTKICVVSVSKNNVKVYDSIIIDTPYNCIEDGYLKDIPSLSEAINLKLREAKIVIKNVVFTISSSKIANREVNLPYVKENKIQEIVNANAEEYFPITVVDYRISYTILEKVLTKEDKHYRLLVLAAHNNLLLTYYELAAALGLHVVTIDYMGNSIYQVLKRQIPSGNNMVVQINEENAIISVLKDGVLELQRTIPYGYTAVIDALLGSSYYHIEDETQAFELLTEIPVINPHFGRWEGKPLEETEHLTEPSTQGEEAAAKEETTEALHYLVNNILRVSDYYTSKNQENKIQTIYITGMGAKLSGIAQLFSNELYMEIMLINQLNCANFSQGTVEKFISPNDFIACIGAVLEPIGMIPKQYIDKEQKKSNIQVVIIFSSMVILGSIALFVISNLLLMDAQKNKNQIVMEIVQLSSIDAIYNNHNLIVRDLATVQAMDVSCESNTKDLIDLISELEKKLPTNTTVHSLRVTSTDVLLDVTADSYETAAMVMKQLKTIELITNVMTSEVSLQVDEKGIRQANFSVTAAYKEAVRAQAAVEQAAADKTAADKAAAALVAGSEQTDTSLDQVPSDSDQGVTN